MIIADWQKDNEYEEKKRHSLPLWGWEFLRRNIDYQTDWKEFFSQHSEGMQHQPHPLKVLRGEDNPDIGLTGDGNSYRKWKVEKYINPRCDRPAELIYGLEPQLIIGGHDRPFFDVLGAATSFTFGFNEFAVVLNTRKSIEGQLQDIKNHLIVLMKTHNIPTVRSPQRYKPDWITYLRVLDARAAFISGDKSAARNKAADNIIKRPKGNNISDAWDVTLRQANLMAEHGYRKLLALQPIEEAEELIEKTVF